MRQVGRTMTVIDEGALAGCRVLICDRDQKWSAPRRRMLAESGVRVVQTPFQAPNGNAHAERVVRSIKDECLNRVIPMGERHLRRTSREFVEHDHRERHHQGLGNELINRPSSPLSRNGAVCEHPRRRLTGTRAAAGTGAVPATRDVR
jgi:transposase InsO family protein